MTNANYHLRCKPDLSKFGYGILLFALASLQSVQSSDLKTNSRPAPAVPIILSTANAEHVAQLIQKLYPKAQVRVDRESNAIIVISPPDDLASIRAIVNAVDVKDPQAPQSEMLQLQNIDANIVASRLRAIFTKARFSELRRRSLLVTATSVDMMQIRTLVNAFDTPTPKPSVEPHLPSAAFSISKALPKDVARALGRALPQTRISVSGSSVVVQGSQDDLAQVKTLLEELDVPRPGVQYVMIYRLTNVDASSAAELLLRSFPGLRVVVTNDINALSVSADRVLQSRIADVIAQLDIAPTQNSGQPMPFSSSNNTEFETISLHAAVPASGGVGASTTASDISQTVTQALATIAPDLKITVQPNSTRLILTGSTHSRDIARKLIETLDVAEPLVELDTRVLEIDQGAQGQLGIKFPTAALTTTYSEIAPTTASGADAPFLQLQKLTRTPLTLGAQLDFLIANNDARILEDPRITTFSGRTATIRAGETVNILTTAGGGTGTVATTQIQSFQTGVTLDITPVVNSNDYITVTLHPSVNSIAGIGTSGVPDIQTRDTTTTVGLHDGETLIIGGLIEDTDTKTVQKIPILGDIPLIGRLFQDVGTSHTRNELVVTVTPHILRTGEIGSVSRLQLAPSALPKIAAGATLPPVREDSDQRSILRRSDANLAAQPSATPTATKEPHSTDLVAHPEPSGSPRPLPNAFGQTNTFTYGAAPQNNYADASQPPRIFFIRAQPTVVINGTSVSISVLSSTNVSSLSIGASGSTQPTQLQQIAPGKWQGTFIFDVSQMPSTSGNVSELLTASSINGTTTSITVPFTIPK